jgi:acetyl esterase/lipase
MKKHIYSLFISIFFSCNMQAQTVITLWPEGKMPNDLKNTTIQEKVVTDNNGIMRISDITTPSMAVYEPTKGTANGTAVLICPGGGYRIEAASHEGTDVAAWFNSMGITAFVLKYRLPDDRQWSNKNEVPLQDAMQAMRLIRENAAKYGVNPAKIGVMGFSAGGHLASTLSTHWHRGGALADETAKPNFSILMYPVISSGDMAHRGSFDALIGKTPTPDMSERYSNEKQVSEKTPPALLIHATDDKAVPVENSMLYYSALKKFNISASMLIYENGGHGFGLATKQKGSVKNWPNDCRQWLMAMGLL